MASQLKQWHGFISTDVPYYPPMFPVLFSFDWGQLSFFNVLYETNTSSLQGNIVWKTRVIFKIVNWLVCHRSRPMRRMQASAECLLTAYSLDCGFSGDLRSRVV